jgi:hypothetical protein
MVSSDLVYMVSQTVGQGVYGRMVWIKGLAWIAFRSQWGTQPNDYGGKLCTFIICSKFNVPDLRT